MKSSGAGSVTGQQTRSLSTPTNVGGTYNNVVWMIEAGGSGGGGGGGGPCRSGGGLPLTNLAESGPSKKWDFHHLENGTGLTPMGMVNIV